MKTLGRLTLVAATMVALVAGSASANMDLLRDMRNRAANAMNADDFAALESIGQEWLDAQENGDIPDIGPQTAAIGFIVAVGLNKGVQNETYSLSADMYKDLVVSPLQAHLEVNRSNVIRDSRILATASKTLFEMQEPKSQEAENLAIWTMWRAVIASHKDDGFSRPVGETTAGLIYQYVEFARSMVEDTEYPELYRYRIRNACQLGLSATDRLDDYFLTWYDRTFFDEENIYAAVLYQKALEMGNALPVDADDSAIQEMVNAFNRAIDATNTNKAKATVYQQLAENVNWYNDRRQWLQVGLQAAQAAYQLNPYERTIRNLYGSVLQRAGTNALTEGNFGKALQLGTDGTSFVHENDFELYMILAQAQQAHGMALDAIKNARTAYLKACTRAKTEADRDYFANTYKGILEGFGQGDKFKPCPGRSGGN